MVETVPTVEPTQIRAGDFVTWRRSLADYPASSGWSLAYKLAGASNTLLTSTANGDDHLVEASASATATFTDGEHRLIGYVEKSGERHTIYDEPVTVLPDPTTMDASYDGRSHAKKTLDALEAVIEGRASDDVQEYTIAGRSLKKMSPDELIKWVNHYRAKVSREERDSRIRRGEGAGGKVKARF